ncbi:HARLDQ motif MBL-fold protein [Salmonella enterica subsp. enterica]|uniref:HARLDQ motif MBL-fold protein n=1 Tax=Salmonella enterica TaxID=28901 RepID=UPI0009A99254|nr:HARLDQ motif MBL-fold protein [Salmonella enterica]EBY9282654.1 HARLDQ motif MBL-fold protein [Salmonella enterica subsp. enterica serovar Denver]ECD1119302.1 HARLDQ motif MBL-fold protein [Salmonella enterica subsp. enterica serovar Oakland]EDU8905642.1 HARLDQ motif MBL-fold protein [Salmonella enterica subsp. enterica]ECD5426096.1 HARLDQ motif MBL-fold protein [Salmonella enterica subsp. enterica serovar Denver]EEH0489757.1 HARLDQ motif MBL-fold protein [Salmonella enterica]
MNRYALFFVCIFSTSALPAMAALDPSQPLSPAPPLSLFKAWAKPIKPFQITEGVWYVGTENLSSILLTTPAGHILIDAGLDESAPQIKANIEAAGFRLTDIRYLLNSHARLDQAGGMARLKAWSGAQLVASQPNADQMARGGREDFALGDALPFPPVTTDKIIHNQESISLGGITVTALFTPGHLPGSTSWRVTLRNGKTLIYADSLATPDYLLINNKNYPDLVTDIQSSFKTLAAQHVDIFIANKGDRFGLLEKRQQLRKGDTQAFFDSNGLQQYVERSRQRFITQLTAQQPQ